jgi:hypothetical protein
MSSSNKYAIELMKDLPEMFEYSALKDKINEALNEGVIGEEKRIMLEDLQWLVDSFYTLEFKHDITERVIFPMSNSESRGIEDARFVRFTDDDGSEKMFATYTAFNGHCILPKLISTEDFYSFNVMPLWSWI